jgi:hypothetical protein
MLGTILLVILILMLLGAVPAWPYSRGWGYAPSGTLMIIQNLPLATRTMTTIRMRRQTPRPISATFESLS